MNWALLREEAFVAEIEETSVAVKYDAAFDELRREGKFKGEPPSIGLRTYMDISLARPYLKPGHRLIVPDSGHKLSKHSTKPSPPAAFTRTKTGCFSQKTFDASSRQKQAENTAGEADAISMLRP